MDIGKFDLVIIVTMSIAIVSMSFTFPALGLTTAGTGSNEIPEFDISPDRFDFAGDFPESPGTPSQGTLEITQSQGEQVTLQQDSGTEIVLSGLDNATTSNVTPDILLNKFNDTAGSPYQTRITLETLGDTATIEDFGYEVDVQWTERTDAGTSNETAYVDWQIESQPSDGGWLTRVPVVGGIVGAGEALAQIVGWIGSIIWWGIAFVFQMAINILGMVVDVAVYFVNTMVWLTTTYTEVISSANAWTSVFVAIPGILLFVEFSKMIMVLISLLPTT